jgi:sigma54-dependent transcription regulator
VSKEFLSASNSSKIYVLTTVRQLAEVLRVCRASRSLAEAGRVLFNHSRTQKACANDSHRLKQYLQKLGLEFQGIVKSA